jgi:hypothetical protein
MTGVGRHHVRWLFHSTAMVADYDLAVRNLGTLVGLTVLEYGESTEPGIGRRGGMAWVGDNAIEIGQPIVEGAASRFVDRFGGGMHSVALQVEDLEATMTSLEAHGVRIAARPTPEMCFTDPRDTGGVFLQWSTFELAVDPRFGGTRPAPAAPVLAPATHHAFVGALVEDPAAWADRFATLLGTAVTFEDHGAAPAEPVAGVSLGDCTLALYRLDQAADPSVWGRTYERACTHLLALRVEDLGAAAAATATSGVAAVGVDADGDLVVLDPAATGGVQVALTGSLLPGDPRL